jgi:hypothetical protein
MISDHAAVLRELKARFTIYDQSNIFFRDIQYGIQAMLRAQGIRVTYVEAERLAREFAERMERDKIFVRRDHQTWALRYPQFKTPRVEKAQAGGQAAAPTAAPAQVAPVPAPAARA